MLENPFEGITPIRIVSSYRLLNSPVGVVIRQKCRRRCGIVWKHRGKTLYKQDGRTILSDQSHIVILPKGAVYEWTCVETGECLVVDFDTFDECFTIRSVELPDEGPVLTAFSKIERLLSTDDPVGQMEAMQQLYGILAFLLRSANKQYLPKGKRNLIMPAVDYITENYADTNISNESLATVCGMSTPYFRKCFKAVYGCSPIRYLQNIRMNKAKAILAGDYDSITQVAESVGYNSIYHFSKMFSLHTGQSPSEFAKSEKQIKHPE